MEVRFSGEVIYWRGPSPWHFVAVPDPQCAEIEAVSAAVSYGWGVIPVTARIGGSTWGTSLFPKDGGYLVPLRTDIRRAEELELDDHVELALTIDV